MPHTLYNNTTYTHTGRQAGTYQLQRSANISFNFFMRSYLVCYHVISEVMLLLELTAILFPSFLPHWHAACRFVLHCWFSCWVDRFVANGTFALLLFLPCCKSNAERWAALVSLFFKCLYVCVLSVVAPESVSRMLYAKRKFALRLWLTSNNFIISW